MSFETLLALGAGCCALVLALVAALKRPRTPAQWAFAAGMTLLAGESALTACRLQAAHWPEVVNWENYRVAVMALLPGAWLWFSLVYSRGNYAMFLARWKHLLLGTVLLPVVVAGVYYQELVVAAGDPLVPSQRFLRLTAPGVALHVVFLLGAVLILVNLERTFWSCVGTMRWRIKFLVIGLGLLFAARIYTGSQCLVYSAVNLPLATVDHLALLLAGLLIAGSLLRSGLFEVDVYPSHRVIHSSLTLVLAGAYLLAVGILAKFVTLMGGDLAFSVKAFLVLVAVVLLAVLLLSERMRERMNRLVSRHFKRPRYDYRTIWSEFTAKTAAVVGRSELCWAVVQWVSDTFQALTVTLWLADETSGELAFGASTSITEAEAKEPIKLGAAAADLFTVVRNHSFPVMLDAPGAPWVEPLKQANPDRFKGGGKRLCVPIVTGDKCLGLMLLGDRVNGVEFTVEELDLLKCIGDQMAGRLLNLELAEHLLLAREMEAFQTMSAFFVHDLKNTASTLSLMLKNLPARFDDPAFREDALRGLGKAVTRINELIGRLSLLRQELELKRTPTDLNALVDAALGGLPGLDRVALENTRGAVDKVHVDPEKLQKVLANLLVNALEALGGEGRISVQTSQRPGWACVAVGDTGCGMSASFVKGALFRPFQTTKKKGIGIGMFLSKRIVEAHGGRIEVDSEPGRGTTFRVFLPLPVKTP